MPKSLFYAIPLAAATVAFAPPAGKYIPATGEIAVAFTPGDAADNLVVQTIRGAKRQILVQAFSFTHREIASELIRAQRRGVEVIVIADPQQSEKIPTSVIGALAAAKMSVFMDHEHVSAHNKIMIVDSSLPTCAVVTGSYNFTHAAQSKNAENLLVLKGNRPVCEAYEKNWRRHRQHSIHFRVLPALPANVNP